MPAADPFISFLLLLVISLVVSGILHYWLKFYVAPGLWSFLSKVVVGYIGAWLGTPVFGNWLEGVNYGDVYILPAVVGSFALSCVGKFRLSFDSSIAAAALTSAFTIAPAARPGFG